MASITDLPGPPVSNIGSISASVSDGSNSSQNSSHNTSYNNSENSQQGTGGASSGSVNSSSGTSFIPNYVQQLAFMNQYGNMAGDLSDKQYNWAQDQFANNSALTNQNINDYLKQSDMASQGAGRDYQNYNDIFTPAASSLNQDWQSYVSPERVSSEMGAAEATQGQAFEGQRKNIERSLESYGINPSDPRYAGAMAANRTAQGASQAAAGTSARLNTENTGRQLRQGALNEAHLLPGQTATEQNVAMQGLTGSTNAAFGNTSLGALTMGTTPQYLNAGVANNKFQPLGNVSGSAGTSGSTSYNQSSGGGTSAGGSQGDSQGSSVGNTHADSSSTPVYQQVVPPGTKGGIASSGIYARGGAIPDPHHGGGMVPPGMSPSGGQQVDDIPATIQQTGGSARLNAGEFVIPQDVTQWMGHKFFQDLIMKSRKARMANPGPAHPTQGPGGVEHHATGGTAGGGYGNPDGSPVTYGLGGGGAGAHGAPNPSTTPYTGPGSDNPSTYMAGGSGQMPLADPNKPQGYTPTGQVTGTVNTPSGTAPQGGTANASTGSLGGRTGDAIPGATGTPNPIMSAPPGQTAGHTLDGDMGGPPAPVSQPAPNGQPNPASSSVWDPRATQTSEEQAKWKAPTEASHVYEGEYEDPETVAREQGWKKAREEEEAAKTQPPAQSQTQQSAGGQSPAVSQPAPAGGQPAIPPTPPQYTNAPLPTGHQLMEGGDYSVAVQHNTPGPQSRLGQGLAAGQQPTNSAFQPKPSYFTPPRPFSPQTGSSWSPVANTPPPPPPSANTTPASPSSVIPPLNTAPAQPRPGAPVAPAAPVTPSSPVVAPPTAPVGVQPPKTGAMPHDNRIHPMLADDVDQLLTWGDQEAQRNQALYAKHGIPMPGGVTFGDPNDPTSFAYQGQPAVAQPAAAPVTNSGQRGMFG